MKPVRASVTTLCLGIICAGSTALAQGQWSQLTPSSAPSSRLGHDMTAFAGNTIVLFGGVLKKNTPSFNDTWSWDGVTWTQLSPATNPAGREGHTMSYDPVRKRIVLFSGWNGNYYITDTWEWDGSNWQNMAPATQPPARDWADMVFDPVSGKTILFGGHDYQVPGYKLNDTWAWDGSNWTQLFPTTVPAVRYGHVMVYDKNLGKVVMFGGTSTSEMWQWTGTDWQQLTPATLPTPRHWPVMEFDAVKSRIVLHGGKDNVTAKLYGDTWEWDGSSWTVSTTGGPAYGWTTGVFDMVRSEILVQGGSTSPTRDSSDGKTWSYSAAGAWTNLFNALPGQLGSPVLGAQGVLAGGNTVTLTLTNAWPNSTSGLFIGAANASLPFYGGTLVPSPNVLLLIPTGPSGAYTLAGAYPSGLPVGVSLYFQIWIQDATGPLGYTASNAMKTVTQ